ncbi:MAG: PAS domain S-box protein [bacterium]|nr:PAS domain S-box protein [bacterium]
MKDVLESFLRLLKVNKVNYLLTSYDGGLIEDGKESSSKNAYKANFPSLSEAISKVSFSRRGTSLVLHSSEKFIIIEDPVHQKLAIIDKNNASGACIPDIIFINEIINSIDESVIILDSNNKIIYFNYIFSSRYGFDEKTLQESFFSEILPPQHLEDVITGMKHGKATFVIEIYDRNGDLASAKIQTIGWNEFKILVIHDIKEKEGWSREIEGLKRMQDLIFDSIAQGILVLDKEGNIIKFNRFTQNKYAFTKEETIGKNIFDLFPEFLKLKLDKIFAEIMEFKRAKKILNLKRYSRRLKKEVVQNLYGYPIVEDGRSVGAVVLIDDITEKKMLEEEYEMVQKKSEIVNDLNAILSETIEMNPLMSNISKYIGDNLSFSRLFVINKANDKICEYRAKEMLPCKETKTNQNLLYLKSLDAKQVRILSSKDELRKAASSAKTECVAIVPVIFNKVHYADFVMEFFSDISRDKFKTGFIQALCNHIGIVFDKAISYEEKKENLKKLEFILKISKVLSQTKEYQKTFRNLMDIISEELKADRCFFVVKTDKEDELRAVAALGEDQDQLMSRSFVMGQGIVGTVAKTNEALILENALEFKNLEYTKGFKRKRQAAIAVPVNFKGEFVGVLMLTRYGEVPFSDEEFELAKIIANNSSSYVKSLLLQMDTENKIEQLSFLYKISTSIRTILNIQLLKRIVTATIGSTSKSDIALLLKLSAEGESKRYFISETYFSNQSFADCLKAKASVPHELLDTIQSAVHLNADSKVPQIIFVKKMSRIVALPINVSEEHRYMLLLCSESKTIDKISDDTYNAVIQELAMKFENAILFQENEKKIKQYNIISKLAEKLTNVKNIEEFFDYLLSSAIEIVDGSIATLLLRDGNNLVFKSAQGVDIEDIKDIKIRVGVGVAGNVAKTGKSAIVNNTREDENFVKMTNLSKVYTVHSMVNVPLIVGGGVAGVICVDNKKTGLFNESDAQFLETLANTAVIALEQFMGKDKDSRVSETILENLPSGIVYMNGDGVIRHVNKTFSRISRLSEKEVLGKKYQKIFNDRNNLISKVLKTEKPIFRAEIELVAKSKDIVPCGISITPIKTGNNLDIVCIIQDLSEIKRIQSELKAKENLAALGQMAAGMAHEIKNPLAGILTGMEFLKMQFGEENTIYTESIDLIIKEVKRLDRLVNDMTSFAKTKTKIVTQINLSNIIEHALEIVRGRLNESEITLSKEIPDDMPLVGVDEEQIVEVLINIFLNAVQAIGRKGLMKITVNHANNSISIDIFNSGPKIDNELIDKIFTPFFTTKSGGTGLGLAISYNIIKEHGGTIRAVNRSDGVSFIITLPQNAK